jgi:hypothetical protein
MTRRVLAWCAHAYTALGLVCAALIAVCISGGTGRSGGVPADDRGDGD